MFKLRKFTLEKLLDLLKDVCQKELVSFTERPRTFSTTNDDFVKSTERDETVAYLLEVCEREDMSLSIESFALFVSLLDRFLSSYKVKSKYLECVSVACLYISCKVKEEDENVAITSEFLIDCNCKCSISEILRMEMMILSKFEWNVNDITAVDFLYLYYAILVNKYNQQNPLNSKIVLNNSKWKILKSFNDFSANDSFYPPAELDFLHVLENNLKQCLCASELASYKPRLLAFSLLSLQVNKNQVLVSDIMDNMKQTIKITDEALHDCNEKVSAHLANLHADRELFDQFLDEGYLAAAREHHIAITNMFTQSYLSAVSTQLTVIKEEDEDEVDKEEKPLKQVLGSISNRVGVLNQKSAGNLSSPLNDMNTIKEINRGLTYADILKGRTDQKRKLSENSSTDEEIDCDIENQRR